jgi:ABC-type glutathione transport system ATPase component
MAPLLEIRDLHVSYTARTGQVVTALAGVSFALERGETLGVLGESGSGKSTLATALLRMLPPSGAVERGSVLFEGQQILQAEPHELQKIRGARIALIFCQNMMEMALELARYDDAYCDVALKFCEHYLWVVSAMDRIGEHEDSLWDESDGFFYDVLRFLTAVRCV